MISTDTQYGIPTSASISEPAATDWATTYNAAIVIVEIPEATCTRPTRNRSASTSAIVYRPALRIRSASSNSSGTNDSSAAIPVR